MGRMGFRRKMTGLRFTRIVVGIATILLVVANLFLLESMEVRVSGNRPCNPVGGFDCVPDLLPQERGAVSEAGRVPLQLLRE